MEPIVVVIDVWRGKAYLPVQARYEIGGSMDVEPVYVADLTAEDLMEAIEKVLGHPRMPALTREEIRHRADPVLKATGARSWKELSQTGASYVIGWSDKETRIDMSRLDKKGRWEYDLAKIKILSSNAPLKDIAAIIMGDIRTRPEVWR